MPRPIIYEGKELTTQDFAAKLQELKEQKNYSAIADLTYQVNFNKFDAQDGDMSYVEVLDNFRKKRLMKNLFLILSDNPRKPKNEQLIAILAEMCNIIDPVMVKPKVAERDPTPVITCGICLYRLRVLKLLKI